MQAETISIIITAHNEADNLRRTVDSILAHTDWPRYEIVLVDDGSQDDTANVARCFDGPLSVEVIRHEVNRGLGAAFLTGFRHVVGHSEEDDLIVTMDADNTHSPKFIIIPFVEPNAIGRGVVTAPLR